VKTGRQHAGHLNNDVEKEGSEDSEATEKSNSHDE
jgi:hypothetical protein